MKSSRTVVQGAVADELLAAFPGVAELRAAARGLEAYLVGGAVRDLLLGAERADLDVAVEGDPRALAARLDGAARVHERFGTATARLDGLRVDIARTRTESYPRPGALPEVRWASLEADLERRDFTVNAMAIPLAGEPRLVDPLGGLADLGAGLLRTLAPGSFADDPTRALRAARYAGRLGLDLAPATESEVRAADLTTVSSERVEAELRRLAREPLAIRALGLLVEWGLVEADLELASAASDVASSSPYAEICDAATVLLAAGAVRAGSFAAGGELAAAHELAAADPARPRSALVELARGRPATELAIARACGAGWIDDYLSSWRAVRLDIGGSDLVAAGVAEGPAVGRGLAAALRAKLDGELDGRDGELDAALRAAGRKA